MKHIHKTKEYTYITYDEQPYVVKVILKDQVKLKRVMTDKEIIDFAYFFERYRYNNEYRHLSDHRFLMVYKFYLENRNTL